MGSNNLVTVLAMAIVVGGCSQDNKPSQGGYNEPCFFGGICNPGLICVADICKYKPDGGTDCDGAYCESPGLAGQGPDEDEDGWGVCCDCDDAAPTAYPDADETCNLVDDDCDGVTDEGFDSDTDGHTSCGGDCDDDNSGIHPDAAENCDGVDEDCDGETDETVEPQACPLAEGVCAGNWSVCLGAEGMSECDYGPVYEQEESTCDGQDNDCDGVTDEQGILLEPEDGAAASDGLDNNCNGLIDEPGGVMVPHPTIEDLWIDAFEATIFANSNCTGSRYGENSDDYPAGWPAEGDHSETLFACSLPGWVPSGHLSWYRAQRACAAQGKRLCSDIEYAIACSASNTQYPYGPVFVAGACNDPIAGPGRSVETGSLSECTAGTNTYDMSGNMTEWLYISSTDQPNSKMVAGHGYTDLICSDGQSCEPYETYPNGLDWVINASKCTVSDHPWLRFPPEQAAAWLGTRCCYDGP